MGKPVQRKRFKNKRNVTCEQCANCMYAENGDIMENELKMCKEILKKVKWYMERKDYSGLRLYIEEREKYVENCRIMSKNKEEEYIDSLVKDLNISNT